MKIKNINKAVVLGILPENVGFYSKCYIQAARG